MTYPELMAKIVKLEGWTWEWKFGDRGSYGNETVIVLGGNNRGFIGTWRPSINDTDAFTIKGLVPLPSVEQWMEKFEEANLRLRITYTGPNEYGWLVEVDQKPYYEEHGEDISMAISILFARVVLGYKWDGKEFVKC